ncbi:hypothetical protein BSM4216_3608 [Bacillus smithii]|nr:hypothetical protein BSM4216_3608 [Bacillus smithii]
MELYHLLKERFRHIRILKNFRISQEEASHHSFSDGRFPYFYTFKKVMKKYR